MSAIERLKEEADWCHRAGIAYDTECRPTVALEDLRALLDYAEKAEAALAAETERANALAAELMGGDQIHACLVRQVLRPMPSRSARWMVAMTWAGAYPPQRTH